MGDNKKMGNEQYDYHISQEDILLTIKNIAISVLSMMYLYTNFSIFIWAADSQWDIFDWPVLNNFKDVLDDWLSTILLIDFIQRPVDFVGRVIYAFHESPAHNPTNDGFKFLIEWVVYPILLLCSHIPCLINIMGMPTLIALWIYDKSMFIEWTD